MNEAVNYVVNSFNSRTTVTDVLCIIISVAFFTKFNFFPMLPSHFVCALIVWPHVWMVAQANTHFLPLVMWCEAIRVSAYPAWAAEACAREQMVVAGQEGSRAQRQRTQWER